MADEILEPKNLSKPVSFDEVFKSVQDQPARIYIPTDPKNLKSSVPYDEVKAKLEAYHKEREEANKPVPQPGMLEKIGKNFETAERSNENKKLGGLQFTSQVPHEEDYVGDATFDELDQALIKGPDGSLVPTDKNKHLIFIDPADGKKKIYNRRPDKDYGPIMGRLVGLGNVVQEGFQPAPTRLPSAVGAATRGQEALAAQRGIEETTGVHVPVPQSMVTESGPARATAKILQAVPGGSAPFEQGAARMEAGLEHAVGEAAGLNTGGVVSNAERAGETARTGITDYAKPKDGILAQRVSKAYDAVDAHVPSDAAGELNNTRRIAGEIQSRFEATKGTSGTNKIDPTLNEVLSAATDPKGVTYQGLKDLRSRVGEMLENKNSIAETGISDKQLRGLYKGLTDDLRAVVKEHGGNRGLQLWERANTYARLASDRREKLGKILGTNRSDESIFGSILNKAGSKNSADAKALELAKKAIPADEWNEISGAVVNRIGRNASTGEFDPSKWANQYSQLSERGKSLLFGDNQRLRKALDSIEKLSRVEEVPHEAGQLATLAAAGATIGHVQQGGFSNMLHLVGGAITGRWLGNLLSKPATAESVAKWLEGYKLMTLKPTKGNVILFDRANQALANDAAKEDRKNMGSAAKTAGHYLKELSSLVRSNK